MELPILTCTNKADPSTFLCHALRLEHPHPSRKSLFFSIASSSNRIKARCAESVSSRSNRVMTRHYSVQCRTLRISERDADTHQAHDERHAVAGDDAPETVDRASPHGLRTTCSISHAWEYVRTRRRYGVLLMSLDYHDSIYSPFSCRTVIRASLVTLS